MSDAIPFVSKKPKVPGPDPKLLAEQKKQTRLLNEREARERSETESRQRAVRARASGGNRQGVTLFSGTGAQGVANTREKLGA